MVCLLTEPAAALHALSHARLCACLWAAVGQANQTADTPDADVGNHSAACVARDLVWTYTTSGCLLGEESCLVVLQPAEVSVVGDLFWVPALSIGFQVHTCSLHRRACKPLQWVMVFTLLRICVSTVHWSLQASM